MESASKNKSSQIVKFLGIILGVGASLFLILIAAIFYYLPSAKQLSGYFKKDKVGSTQIVRENKLQASKSAQASSSNVSLQSDQESTSDQVSTNQSSDKIKEFEKLKEFIDEKTPAMVFCSKLNQAKSGSITALSGNTHKEIKNVDGTKTQVNTTFDSEELEEDLRLEAIKPFFKTVLKQPEMQRLISMVIQDEEFMKASAEEQEGMFDKALFYKQAYSAYSEMKEHLPEYESIVDRSYLMYKLNDLIVLKPDLQKDPRIMKFCEESEYQSNSYAAVDFASEKQVFERLIQELGVDPKSIKYDPHYKTTLDLKFSGQNLQIGGGWLNELMPQPDDEKRRN
jgi:hypothetical protein